MVGWKKTTFPVNWVVLVCVLIPYFLDPLSTYGAEDTTRLETDMEFLEFLGEWETEEGEWVNPMDFLDSFPVNRPADTTDPYLGPDGSVPNTDNQQRPLITNDESHTEQGQ